MSGFWSKDNREKWNDEAINSLLEQRDKSRFDRPVKKKRKPSAVIENEEYDSEVKELTSNFEQEIFGKEIINAEDKETNTDNADAEGADIEEDAFADIARLIDSRILRAIKKMGFTKLSPIQEQAIPGLLNGEDIIGQAQTGTGKTAAFGIPAIQKLDPGLKKLQVIILCPTRELAIQAADELRRLAEFMHGVKILPVYGGQEIGRQIAGLRGVQIVVGTPGRVMDHMRRHTIKLDDIRMVVLDEADEMLNMGFREDME
ncbi:MAG: DEAD/DEAH box helicase, partial [Lachnospiraceae bacterium]|nr:DEAD/DEAH box helicase [Lachnospiraceae bacterium]